jgi:hypothetical protein
VQITFWWQRLSLARHVIENELVLVFNVDTFPPGVLLDFTWLLLDFTVGVLFEFGRLTFSAVQSRVELDHITKIAVTFVDTLQRGFFTALLV